MPGSSRLRVEQAAAIQREKSRAEARPLQKEGGESGVPAAARNLDIVPLRETAKRMAM